jgi:hypothetical protein
MKIRLLHLAALTGFALGQPLYDVLGQNGEFFVAHRVDRLDILLLIAWFSILVPVVLWALVAAGQRVHRRVGDALMLLAVGALTMVIVLPPAGNGAVTDATELVTVSALHGVLAALLYARFAGVRQFLTLLSPAAIVFPVVFLAQPEMRPFVHPAAATATPPAVVSGKTPVVFVIFDQLPLTSLLDGTGAIDSKAFPAFGSLAADGVWYRNATTVADFTGWAVPAILTGSYPGYHHVPTVADYPHNLFTALGGPYRIESTEPITHLCPDALCPEEREPRSERQVSMLSDLWVVYQQIVLPDELTEDLPRVTDNWRDFARTRNWQQRWVTARDEDRLEPMRALIDSISATDPQPTLYFTHILLPHEPYIYLPDGRHAASGGDSIGLQAKGRWSTDPWFSTQTYRWHLEQLGCADFLLGGLIDRLKHEGLYDRALIVVTSDHGVSFRPGMPMKGFSSNTIPDIVPVPLIIKPPQYAGVHVSDRNVQSIDILPTIADILHAKLPFQTEGVSILGGAPPAPGKKMYYGGAARTADLPPSLHDAVMEGAARKKALFGDSSPANMWLPAAAPFRELIGQRVEDLDVGTDSDLRVQLDAPWRYAKVDLKDPLIPARVEGRVRGRGAATSQTLAVAVNGTLAGTTKSAGNPLPSAGEWAALTNPSLFKSGANAIDVYEVGDEHGHAVLHPALRSSRRPSDLNLVHGEAYYNWNVRDTGMYGREPFGQGALRWTNGDASFTMDNAQASRAARLHVTLARMTRARTPLTLTVNGCTVFDGVLPGGEWDRTLSLTSCPAATFQHPTVTIGIKSGKIVAAPPDNRVLGVPLVMVQFGQF